jgi:hypothetical protein
MPSPYPRSVLINGVVEYTFKQRAVGPLYGKVYVFGNQAGKHVPRSVGGVQVANADCEDEAAAFNEAVRTNVVSYKKIATDKSCGASAARLLGYAYTEKGCGSFLNILFNFCTRRMPLDPTPAG